MAVKNKHVKTPGTPETGMLFNVFFTFVVLILPFVYYRSAQDPSLLPRLLILASFLIGYSIYHFFLQKTTIPIGHFLKNPVMILGGLYLVMSVLSLFFSLNKSEGLFDIAKTGLTLILITNMVYLFAITKKWFEKLSELVVISSWLAILIGFYQYFTLVAGNSVRFLPDGREIIYAVSGLMGYKNGYASSLMLMLPFTAYVAFTRTGWWRAGSLISIVLTLIMLIMLATRAVWVGLLVSGFMVFILVWFFRDKLEVSKSRVRIMLVTGLVLFALIGAGLLEGGRFTHSPLLKKMGSVVRPGASNNHFRLGIWKITTKMALDHPVTGVGPGNWQIMIPEYYRKIRLKDKEVNWIAPHNDFLWIWSEKGFIGLFLYLGMIALTVYYFFRVLGSNLASKYKRMALTLFAGLAGYLAVAFFDFPYQRIDHQVMFALFLGGMIALFQQLQPGKTVQLRKTYIAVPILLFLVFSVVYCYQGLKVETHIKKALAMIQSGNHTAALSEIDQARNPWKSMDAKGSPVDYYAGMAWLAGNNNPAALASYKSALLYHPNHVATLSNLGKCYYATGYNGMAEHYYRKALDIVPGYKEARVNLSTLYYMQGKYKKSYKMLKGVKGERKTPEIRQNRKALEKLLGYPADSVKSIKHKDKKNKKHKKNKKQKTGE
jgi:O-antigen ligase